MAKENNLTTISRKDETEEFGVSVRDSFFHEINLLKIEGKVFLFDPKNAPRRERDFTDEFEKIINDPKEKIQQQNVRVIVHPLFGRPSTVAYKLYQVVLKKLSDYGYPWPDTVCFSYRELGRLMGYKDFGRQNQRLIKKGLDQLLHTAITCWAYIQNSKEDVRDDKERWQMVSFRYITNILMSGTKGRISNFCVKLDSIIIQNLNNRYAFCLNYSHIATLDPIAAALYKRLFYHFSNLYRHNGQQVFPFQKDYGAVCREWLGGLTVRKFKYDITRQLQTHFDSLKKTKLISKVEVEKNKAGNGFNLVFYPGKGFYEDYENFSAKKTQLMLQFSHASDRRKIQEPLELVSYFYERLYNNKSASDRSIFSPRETDLASLILVDYSFEDAKSLVDYALDAARKTGFDIKQFGGIRSYLHGWPAEKERWQEKVKKERQRKEAWDEEHTKEEYQYFRRERIARIRDKLSLDELKQFEHLARSGITKDNINQSGLNILVRIKTESLLAERFHVPTFEEWRKTRQTYTEL